MRQISVRVTDELREAINEARGDIPRERWIRRALEAALSEAKDPAKVEQADPGSVPSTPDGVRSATPSRALAPIPFVDPEARCNPCKRHGPPRSGRPCSSCGHSSEHS